ncbi:unnamed protein product [Phyllotreta striolata]|uniref:Uncharacterized protein n=1 Tax=Phyllotreta striolata TaxID=444603 RepID=A0A9N9TD63_PHYSR|nr:unnamed protein product [Phyllotreta striolata]
MAFTKSALLFICTVFLASQVQSSYISYNVNDDDLSTIVQKIVALAEKVVDKVLSVVASLISGANTDFSGTQSKVLDVIGEVLKKGIDAFNNVLGDLSKDSGADGQKLIKCLVSEESDSVAVVQNLVKSITNCAQKDLVALLNKVDPLAKDLTSIGAKAKTELARLDKCKGSDTQALLCIIDAVTKTFDAIKDDLPTIQKDIEPIKDDLPAFKDAVVSCWTNSVKKEVLSDAAKVLAANITDKDLNAYLQNLKQKLVDGQNEKAVQEILEFGLKQAHNGTLAPSKQEIIQSCIDSEKLVQRFSNATNDKIKKCATVVLAQYTNVVTNSYNDVQVFMMFPSVIWRNIQKCGLDATCKSLIVDDVIKETYNIPPRVFNLAAKIQSLVVRTITAVDNCAIDALKDLSNTGTKLVAGVYECIIDRTIQNHCTVTN